MIIESGMLVAMGLLIVLFKCGWKQRMWVLSNPVKMDLFIFALLCVLHGGSATGMLVAAIGAFVCSGMLMAVSFLVGSIKDGKYIAGMFNIEARLK